MWSASAPITSAETAYTLCISRVTNIELARRLAGGTKEVVSASAAFAIAAGNNSLHALVSSDFQVKDVLKEEMGAVYDGRMAKLGSVGRSLYDNLRLSSGEWCPLCGLRAVATLDHHLPKSSFPALAVAPLNLVPACSDCNHTKASYVPLRPEEATLHPYFDNIEADHWLKASVTETSPEGIAFWVDPPPAWSAIMSDRARNHFRRFKISPLYTAQAAQEVVGIRFYLTCLLRDAGVAAVTDHLREQAISRSHSKLNSWQAAAYTAMAQSAWFCQGGFV